jgi:hypothetical protein
MLTISSNIQVSEGSITEPVTLGEAKAWAMVDHGDHDSLLTSMITGAREDIEAELNAKLVDSSVIMYMTTTQASEYLSKLPYALSFADVSLTSVSLVEDGEADEVLTGDEDYYFNGVLKIAAAQTSKVEYEITPVVPQAIKEAIMMLVAYRYNNRGDQPEQHGLPADIERKISKYRQIWL